MCRRFGGFWVSALALMRMMALADGEGLLFLVMMMMMMMRSGIVFARTREEARPRRS